MSTLVEAFTIEGMRAIIRGEYNAKRCPECTDGEVWVTPEGEPYQSEALADLATAKERALSDLPDREWDVWHPCSEKCDLCEGLGYIINIHYDD